MPSKKKVKKMPTKPRVRATKKVKKPSYSKRTNLKPLVFVLVFALIGAALLLITRAATQLVLEGENATPQNSCAKVISDSSASGSSAMDFTCASASGFVHPGVVYTKADIDTWSPSSSAYTTLAGKAYGKLDRTEYRYKPLDFEQQISYTDRTDSDSGGALNERDLGLKDQSGYAKVQAVLWAADGNNERRNRVIEFLQEYSDVTSFETDAGQQYRLVAGWGCTNLAQAAEIIEYQDAGFKNFLKNVCYPVLDWSQNPNWHASFADSRLAIAAYLGDEALWTDAKAYYNKRIAQSIYHATYDSGKIKPLLNSDNTTPNLSLTIKHWGGEKGCPQVETDLVADYPNGTPFPNGTNAERRRDLGHVNMSLGAWMHGARTIRAQGEQVEQQAYDRLLAAYDYHSKRVYDHTTNVALNPPTCNGDGGPSRFAGYYGAKQLFKTATPASVMSMIGRSEVNSTYSAAVQNHLVAERFADETGGTTTTPSIGIAKGSINAPSAGVYRVWARIKAPNSTANAVQVQVDDGTVYKMGDTAIATNTWTWVDYYNGSTGSKVNLTLEAGDHNVTLTGIEPGIKVDKIIILSNLSCTPTGDGTDCTNPPNVIPSVSLTTPLPGTNYTSPASVTIQASANDVDGTVSKVEFYNGSTKLGEDTSSPYSYTWSGIGAGSYSLTAKAVDDDLASKTSAAASIVVATPPPPSVTVIPAPTNFKVKSVSSGKVTLVWDKSPVAGVDEYMLRYTRADSATVGNYSTWTYPARFPDNTYTATGLTNDKTYYFQVRAVDNDGPNGNILGNYTNTLSGVPKKKTFYFF